MAFLALATQRNSCWWKSSSRDTRTFFVRFKSKQLASSKNTLFFGGYITTAVRSKIASELKQSSIIHRYRYSSRGHYLKLDHKSRIADHILTRITNTLPKDWHEQLMGILAFRLMYIVSW
jgi:hypothetical protein